MKLNTTRSIAMLLAGLVALSVMPMGAMAAPSTDTSGGNQTEVTDNSSYTSFNASGNIGWLNASYDSDNIKLEIIDPESGEVVNTIGNGSDRWTEYNTSTDEYGINLSEDDFVTMPMDANANKSVTLRLHGNISKDNGPTTNLTIYLENTKERAVIRAGSGAEDSGLAEVEETDPGAVASFLGAEEENTTVLEKDSVGINGSATDVYVVYANETTAEPYETAAEDKTPWYGFGSTDYEDGDKILDHVVIAEDMHFYSYSEEAPEEVVDNEDATYAEYMTLNGEPTHKLVLGDEDFDDESSVDVTTKGNMEADLGFGEDIHSFEEGGILGFSLQTAPGVYGQAGA